MNELELTNPKVIDEPIASNLSNWRGDMLVVFSGSILPLSFAPYELWWFGILACSSLALCLKKISARRALWRSFLFALGMYGTGVSWVYVSIHDFAYTPAWLASIMTAMFVAFMALVFCWPFYFYKRCVGGSYFGVLLGFPATWVISEWVRSWFLTGFPWLYLGYGHTDSWLAGWSPVFGVYGLSFLAAFTATSLLSIQRASEKLSLGKRWHRKLSYITLSSVAAIWLGGLALTSVNWTTPTKELSVSIVQPNIPLEVKWNPLFRGEITDTLLELTEDHWQSDIIVWPEAAIPMMYHEADFFIEELQKLATANNTALVSGILYDDEQPNTYYNSIFGMGTAENIYFKQRLVPFGEYVPLEKYLRGLIRFFDLPNSIIHRGPLLQEGIKTNEYSIAPYICYEIVYPDLVANMLGDAQLLVTISNDAWFGESIGPLQHFQMAQMRALETGRYVIRGTNTGLSGIISHKGEVTLAGTQFKAETITGKVMLTEGKTPFARFGSWPMIIISFMIFLALALKHRLLG
ncbi:Apolipoprotein N-acyltransferase [Alteromonadaceae bacterium Bs31]|nr:Apolipoprotein N-acyltransferase [Alteromonadaceae bacterium Bs31]